MSQVVMIHEMKHRFQLLNEFNESILVFLIMSISSELGLVLIIILDHCYSPTWH